MRRAPGQRGRSGRVRRQPAPRTERGFERRRGLCRDRGIRGRGRETIRSSRRRACSPCCRRLRRPRRTDGPPLWVVTSGAQQASAQAIDSDGKDAVGAGRRRRRGRRLGLRASAAQRDSAPVAAAGRFPGADGAGPSAGARWSRSWRPQPRKPRSSGPGRAAMYRVCVAVCRRAGRLRAMRWRSTQDGRAASMPCSGSRPLPARRDREKFRSTSMPPGSISAM